MARSSAKGTGASFRAVEAAATRRRAGRVSPFEAYAARREFDWSDISPAALCDGISHATARGATVTFSLTKDGGAVHLSMWLDNQKSEAYAGDADTLNELLGKLAEIEDSEGE